MTIPNLITIFRLILVPIVIVMILQEEWRWAFALFAITGISDGLDGNIARQFDMRSKSGASIDPLADKVLLASIYITLAIVEVIPSWLAIVVVSRDIMIVPIPRRGSTGWRNVVTTSPGTLRTRPCV